MIETNKKILAITGSIGSGKSTFAKLLAQQGVPSIDADKLAHAVLAPESSSANKVIELLGPEIIEAEGTLNRKLIAEKVFSSQQLKTQLEAIMHPAICLLYTSDAADE